MFLLKNLKIKNKFFFVSLLLLFIFSFIGILTFNYFSNLYEKKIYEEAANNLQITSNILDQEIKKIEKLSFQISTDDVIQSDLKSINENKFNYQMYRTKVALIEQLESLASSEKYITSILITDSNNINYTAGYKTKIYNNLDKVMDSIYAVKGSNIWLNLGEENILTASRLIRDKKNINLTNLGILNISIDMDEIINENLSFVANKDIVIKRNNNVVYNKNSDVAMDGNFKNKSEGDYYKIQQINNHDYLITYNYSKDSGLTYYNILPFENITKQTKFYKILMIYVFLIMLILTIILSYNAAKSITKPLEELTREMQLAKNGVSEKITNDNNSSKQSNDEVGALSKNFQSMMHKINDLNRKNYQKQLIIKETEYRALQSQINPHFLYNTLDSINWLAQMNKQDKISNMTEALGNMMRNIISKKAPLISIKEEMDIVHSYITIQKYRYVDRLEFNINDVTTYAKVSIPKLTIQPIVENAIQHGLEEIIGPCHITIQFSKVKDNLEITIQDNGPGISEETIDAIYNDTIKNKRSGIGLSNIIERIKLMFGPQYGVEIESEINQGTKVKIILPLTRGENDV